MPTEKGAHLPWKSGFVPAFFGAPRTIEKNRKCGYKRKPNKHTHTRIELNTEIKRTRQIESEIESDWCDSCLVFCKVNKTAEQPGDELQ